MFETMLKAVNFDAINADLNKTGFHTLPALLPEATLKETIKQMDDICETKDDLEVNYGGSEHRLWKANDYIPAAQEFNDFSNEIIPKLEGGMGDAHNILAIRNKPLSENKDELRKGRWHLDSFNKQLKIFVFMKDVGKDDGPFELIPRTQDMKNKVKHIIPGHYFRLRDIVKRDGKRGYQHIDEKFIAHIERDFPTEIFTVPAGTVLIADTSAIHRAHPVNGGERYAFTSYH